MVRNLAIHLVLLLALLLAWVLVDQYMVRLEVNTQLPYVGFMARLTGGGLAYPPEAARKPSWLLVIRALALVILLNLLIDGIYYGMKRRGIPTSGVARQLLNLCLLLFLLLFLESGLRYYNLVLANPMETFRPDPNRFWRLNQQTLNPLLTVNRFGLRGLDIPDQKEPGEFRILCMGDSITAGDNLSELQAYPFHLERFLRPHFPGRRIRVINGGVFGSSAFQGYMMLREVYPHIKPDLLVVGYTHANPDIQELVDQNVFFRYPSLNRLREWLYLSDLYMFLRKEIAVRKVLKAGAGLPTRRVPGRDENRANNVLFQRYYSQIMEFARSRDITMVVYIPYLRDLKHWRTGPYYAVRYFAEDNHLPLVDLQVRWGNRDDIDRVYMADDCHPNAPGSVLQARNIGEFLLKSQLIR